MFSSKQSQLLNFVQTGRNSIGRQLPDSSVHVKFFSHVALRGRSFAPRSSSQCSALSNGLCGAKGLVKGLMRNVRFFGVQVQQEKRVFNDRVRLSCKGGRGGGGCSSFERRMDGNRGPPNGEDGGKGGNIYLESCNSMESFSFHSFHYKGQHGSSGGSSHKKGKNGKHTVIKVPPGTAIYEVIGRDEITNRVTTEFIGDLHKTGQQILVAKGGTRGLGNSSFKTNERTYPEFATTGGEGEHKDIVIELKSIADVGLIGYPNAGKSSLLRAISNATPKVASYPFTTLKPNVGVVTVDDSTMASMYVADIPGLIDGASDNIGLGHDFLRHVERVKVLLYVVDIAGTEGRDPIEDYFSLYKELQLYDPELVKRKSLIFCNKIDRKPKTCAANIKRLKEATSLPIVEGSALKKTNLDELIQNIWYHVQIQESQSRKQALKLTKKDKEEIFFGSI